MKFKLLFFLCFILYFNSNKANQNVVFDHLSMRDGLSQNSIIRIFQDSKDRIWIATRNGLNLYNGNNFIHFYHSKNSNSLSSSDITSLAEDCQGNLWIGTHNGLNKLNTTGEITRYFKNDSLNSINDNVIKHLYYDSNKTLWIGTQSGIQYYKPESNSFEKIFCDKPTVWILELQNGTLSFTDGHNLYIYNHSTKELFTYHYTFEDEIYTLFQDKNGNLWIGTTASGLKVFDLAKGSFSEINLHMKNEESFNKEQIGYIVENEKGNLLLASRKGLIVYNPIENICIEHYIRNGKQNGLCDNAIITLFKDNSNGIWIGTYGEGLNYYSNYSSYFKLHEPKESIGASLHNYNAIGEVDGILWFATNNGLVSYNPKNEKYEYYFTNKENIEEAKEIKYLKILSSGKILLSAYGEKIMFFDPKSHKVIYRGPRLTNFIKTAIEDGESNFWITQHTNETFGYWDSKKEMINDSFFINNSKEPLKIVNAIDIIKDFDNSLWIATRNMGLYHYDPIKQNAIQYTTNIQDTTTLPVDNICSLFLSKKNQFWIGTYGGGLCLYNRKENNFQTFDQKQGLSRLVINAISEDNVGNIWLTTELGVSKFNIVKKSFTNYTQENGFPLDETSLHALYRSKDDVFYIGGSNGFVSFCPDNLKKNPIIPKMTISGIKLWNKSTKSDSITYNLIFNNSENPSITLPYNQATFTINYASLNYVHSHLNQYAYKIDGIDDNWKYVGNINAATFTNLAPGKYIFHVKGSNNDNVWSNQDAILHIIIKPPFWSTWIAYLLYFTLFIMLVIFVISHFHTKIKLENSIKIKSIEQKSIEETHQAKLRLFTNFSHELRTPLTLIIAPLNSIIKELDKNTKLYNSLSLIQKNAKRLLIMINQLLDIRKIESGKLKLFYTNDPIYPLLQETINAFGPIIESKKISYKIDFPSHNFNLWYDSSKLEEVFINIISNSLKHLKIGGTIDIVVKVWSTSDAHKFYQHDIQNVFKSIKNILEISFFDNGSGIETADLKKIFDPFYQASQYEHGSEYGSGIGLNFTKEIIELHGGIIWAESTFGHGATFRIFLPLDTNQNINSTMNEDKIGDDISKKDQINLVSTLETVNDNSNFEFEEKFTKHPTILLVEDNVELCSYMRDLLRSNYTVEEAHDGEEGLEKALSIIPDIIISDIMMPKLTGNELCSLLKHDERTSHIPIVLLTACQTPEEVQKGLMDGADDYIIKPFDNDELICRITSILKNRELLRNKYIHENLWIDKNVHEDSPDEIFLNKVYEYIKKNISNPDLLIEDFAGDIGMGRVQLYRKIKALVGCSPSKLILNIRMKEAASLIVKNNLSIAEICYKVGFNSPSYFGKCFKNYFGTVPSEYKLKSVKKIP